MTAVVYALQRLCFGHFVAGDRVAAAQQRRRGTRLASSIGQPALTALPIAWLALLAAVQGRDDYDGLLSDLEEVVAAHPLGIPTDPVHDLARWARAMRTAAAGDAVGALHHLGRIRLPVTRPDGRGRAHRRRRTRRRAGAGRAVGSTSSPASPWPRAGRGRSPPWPTGGP